MRRVDEEYYEFCGDRNVCAYCGVPADEIDHTVPVSFVNQKPDVGGLFKFMKVQSCGECNRFASDYIHQTFFERRLCIAKAFTRKYSKELKTRLWSEEEIQEMGHSLRNSIRGFHSIQISVRKRLSVLRCSVLPDGIRDNLWEPIVPLDPGMWSGPSHGKTAQKIIDDIHKTLRRIDKIYDMWGK